MSIIATLQELPSASESDSSPCPPVFQQRTFSRRKVREPSQLKLLSTEVVPESQEGSLMLAGHALALVGVPMRRVIHIVQQYREQRYGLLRGYFHGADDVSEDEMQEERLASFTLPEAVAGRRLAEVLAGSANVRAVSMRSRTGKPTAPSDDAVLQGGETLVLSGKAEALAAAERVLAA